MAKNINKCFSGHFYEKKQMRQAGFLFIFFYFPKIDEATFFKSEKRQMKGIETDERGPEKQLTFFHYLIEI